MSWVDLIREFVPFNEQEIKDKEATLKYINMFENILKRDNELIHITSSGFVINKNKDKVLMVHHNIFNAWSLTGGHADGKENLIDVAMSEITEETGVKDIHPITNKIVSLDILPVLGHLRKGKFITSHLHISVTYLFQADENEQLIVQQDENSAVKWIPINEIDIYSSEFHMKKIYNKIISKIEN
ncbi:NUDIX hydrolase [Tissierella praeacuta]|uniref:NUDIX hydrolase n=1 Tax=Tissierella praeacuta TaxID=43131 RepID=UPI00333E84B4